MAATELHGGQVVYELPGPLDGQPIVLTPLILDFARK